MFFDFPEELELLIFKNSSLEDLFDVRNLKQRKLYIEDEICTASVGDIVKFIMQYNADDKDIDPKDRQPILLYINSPGGEVPAGLSLIDAIESSKTPVYTINNGIWYSMAFIIGISGHKRFATKNATFLMHDGSSGLFDSTSKMRDTMQFQLKLEDNIKNHIINHTGITKDDYEKNLRVEWYMFADEAKKHGVIDYIVGEDCSIDEVV